MFEKKLVESKSESNKKIPASMRAREQFNKIHKPSSKKISFIRINLGFELEINT